MISFFNIIFVSCWHRKSELISRERWSTGISHASVTCLANSLEAESRPRGVCAQVPAEVSPRLQCGGAGVPSASGTCLSLSVIHPPASSSGCFHSFFLFFLLDVV